MGIGCRCDSEWRKNIRSSPRNRTQFCGNTKKKSGWVSGRNRCLLEDGGEGEKKNYTLHLCDCRHLPFENETVDVIINQFLLDILPVDDFIPILLEFKRVLKDGGRIILVNMTKGERWLNQIYEEAYKLKLPLLAGCRGVMVNLFSRRSDLENSIESLYLNWDFHQRWSMG